MATMIKRYSIVQVRQMCYELEEWISLSQDTLNNEEAKDYPNDERVDTLTTRIDALQTALDALQEIE